MLSRKVVQIAALAPSEQTRGAVSALCDDGSVWLLPFEPSGREKWYRVEPLPQIDQSAEEVLRQLILPWSEFSDEQLDARGMFDQSFRDAIKAARRLTGWRPGIGW